MGGFAAKQRRRVERQSLQRPQTDFNDDDDKNVISPSFYRNNNNHNSNTKRSLKSSTGSDTPQNRRTTGSTKNESRPRRNRNTGGSSSAITSPAKRKKDIKKPKHLKRKIESISGESTEEATMKLKEKERLLQQLEEFERKKRELRHVSQNSPITPVITKRKLLKTNHSTSTDHVTRKVLIDEKMDHGISASKVSNSKRKHETIETISEVSEVSATLVSKNTFSNETLMYATENKKSVLERQDLIVYKDNTAIVSNDDDDDDNDPVLLASQNTRQRGKRLRRRGQNQKGTEDSKTSQQSSDVATVDGLVSSDAIHDPENKSNSLVSGTATEPEKRRCIGRKPITDFGVGKQYSGTVVYTKPFGIFIDIGCHYDAFCHVSQLSSVFIENPIETYPMGSKLDEIRIVEIDRKKKRLTVSLKKETVKQSQKQKLLDYSPTNTNSNDTLAAGSSDPHMNTNKNAESATDNSKSKPNENDIEETKRDANDASINQVNGTAQKVMSTAEQLKRDRKLARRAERRNNHSNDKK